MRTEIAKAESSGRHSGGGDAGGGDSTSAAAEPRGGPPRRKTRSASRLAGSSLSARGGNTSRNTNNTTSHPQPPHSGSSAASLQPQQHHNNKGGDTAPALAHLVNASLEVKAVREIGFLFQSFQVSRYYWEIVVRCRARCATLAASLGCASSLRPLCAGSRSLLISAE